MEFHSEVGHKFRDWNVITKNPKASCSRPKVKLRDFLMSDKPALSYADFHHEIIRNAGLGISKSSARQQSHGTRAKASDDETVKHISKFPSHLEKGKSFQETPLAVSSLDWRHLNKLYKHNPMPTQNNGHSPSTSSSSYFSTDGSSSHSNRGNISSPGHQRTRRSPFQSHLEALPLVKNYIQDECYLRKGSCTPVRQRAYHPVPQSHHPKDCPLQGHFEDVNSSRRNAASTPSHMLRQKKLYGLDQNCATNRSGIRLGAFERKVSDSSTASELGKQQKTGNLILAFSVKGKMRIQESELKQERKQSHEPNLGDCNPNCSTERQASVLLLRDPSLKSKSSHFSDSSVSDYKVPGDQRLKSLFQEDDVKEFQSSNFCSRISYSCPLPSTDDDGNKKSELGESCSMATAQGVNISHQQFMSPSRSRNTVDMRLIAGFKSPSRIGSESTVKVRQSSPIRRLSSAVGSFIRSAGSKDNSPLRRSSSKDSLAKLESDRAAASISLDESCTDTSQANSRAKSSPLRRLLDPLLKPKAPNAREVAQPSKKDSSMAGHWKSSDEHLVLAKSTFDSGRTKSAKDSPRGLKQGLSLLQALLQVSIKNGHPLFTFAVDNNSDILAATLKQLSAQERNSSSWIYTFFTVHEMKKKNGLWLNHGTKGNCHSYVPNVIAQMKVSNPQFPINTRQKGTNGVNLREFTLFSVDTGQVDQDTSEFQPTDELAAIVAKIVKPESDKPIDPTHTNSSECSPERSRCSIRSQNLLSTTVILPGGVHTIPSKGSLSTLTQRWRSGGSCDCGGWDEGCQLRIFNQRECENLSNSLETATALDEFKLFSQVGQETQLVLSLKPYKDRIYSVKFHPSISLLQAFGTSVAVLDCRSSSGHFSDSNVVEVRASTAVISDDPFRIKVTNQSQGEAPGGHVSYPPPHSPFGRV